MSFQEFLATAPHQHRGRCFDARLAVPRVLAFARRLHQEIDREDFPVMALSFCKLAGLMVPQRRGQELGNLMRGVEGCAERRRRRGLLPLFRRYSSLFSVHSEGLILADFPK